MNTLRNERGFTLIELVLIIVILGILGAVATVQFGSIMTDANTAALDSGAGPYNAQLALSVNALKRLPTAAEFDTNVFTVAKPSGGKVTHTDVVAAPNVDITMQINATCVDVWRYNSTSGTFIRNSSTRGGC